MLKVELQNFERNLIFEVQSFEFFSFFMAKQVGV